MYTEEVVGSKIPAASFYMRGRWGFRLRVRGGVQHNPGSHV